MNSGPIIDAHSNTSASENTAIVPSKFRFSLPPLIVTLLSLIILACYQPAAASDPAVSDLNAKLNLQGGSWGAKDMGIGSGSLTVPLSHSFGAQIDAGAGAVDSKAYWGTGSHLFWRDPSIGLLGLTYSYQRWSDFDFGYLNNSNTTVIKDAYMHRGGAEGEFYLSRITLGGRGGYQEGTVKADGYGQLKLRYYATDNLSLHVTDDYAAGQNLIRGGLEIRPNLDVLTGLSFFADGGYGSHDYAMAQAGIRYYFGKSTNLIKRDRYSDPDSLITDDTNAFIQQTKNMRNGQVPVVVAPVVLAPPVVTPPVVVEPPVVVTPPVVVIPPVVVEPPPVVTPPVVTPPVVVEPPVVVTPPVAPPVLVE